MLDRVRLPLASFFAVLVSSGCAAPPSASRPPAAPTAAPPPSAAPDPIPTPAPSPHTSGLQLRLVPDTVNVGESVTVQIWNAGPGPATLHDPGGSNGCAVQSGHSATLRSDNGLVATSYATSPHMACTMVFVPPSDTELAPGQSVDWTRIATGNVHPMSGAEGGVMAVQAPIVLAPGRYEVTAGSGLSAVLVVR